MPKRRDKDALPITERLDWVDDHLAAIDKTLGNHMTTYGARLDAVVTQQKLLTRLILVMMSGTFALATAALAALIIFMLQSVA